MHKKVISLSLHCQRWLIRFSWDNQFHTSRKCLATDTGHPSDTDITKQLVQVQSLSACRAGILSVYYLHCVLVFFFKQHVHPGRNIISTDMLWPTLRLTISVRKVNISGLFAQTRPDISLSVLSMCKLRNHEEKCNSTVLQGYLCASVSFLSVCIVGTWVGETQRKATALHYCTFLFCNDPSAGRLSQFMAWFFIDRWIV